MRVFCSTRCGLLRLLPLGIRVRVSDVVRVRVSDVVRVRVRVRVSDVRVSVSDVRVRVSDSDG